MATNVSVSTLAGIGSVQATLPSEREQILEIAAAADVFNAIELSTVDELLAGYFRDPRQSGYNFLSYREAGAVLGFATWGPRSLSERGYDLYWIATRPDAQRRGVARALLLQVEDEVRARGGGWVWVETSSTELYTAARAFYEKCGYSRLAVLEDFYHNGDGLVIYLKRI
ncbi:MAG TPA: N-acetyltransferase [Anaerolineae bacterium]|nr:N-acetyltransferase [Anaerolineae bacterium]